MAAQSHLSLQFQKMQHPLLAFTGSYIHVVGTNPSKHTHTHRNSLKFTKKKKTFNLCVCVSKCICHMCEVSLQGTEGVGFPEVGITDDCKVPNIGTEKQTPVPWENRRPPRPLSHLSHTQTKSTRKKLLVTFDWEKITCLCLCVMWMHICTCMDTRRL